MDEHLYSNQSHCEPDDDYDRAAEWLDTMADGALDELTQRRFSVWINGHERRRLIIERMLATWENAALDKASEQYIKSVMSVRDSRLRESHFFQLPRIAFALCLGVMLVGTGIYFGSHNAQFSPQTVTGNNVIVNNPVINSLLKTTVSVGKNYQLIDGSNVELSPQTHLAIHFSTQKRDLELHQGAAYFQVAHDKSRPFDVHIGDVSVVAVGTEFTIDRFGAAVDITVYEGIVAVRQNSQTQPLALRAGEHARIENGHINITSINLATIVDWRSGWIEINNEPLAFLLEHLNRYTTTPIVVKDIELNSLRLAGRFQLHNTAETLAMLAELYSLDIHAIAGVQEIRRARKNH